MMRIAILSTAALLESSYATRMAKDQVKVLPLISIYQTDCGPGQSGEKDIEYRNNNEKSGKNCLVNLPSGERLARSHC